MQQPTRILKVPAAIFERAQVFARHRNCSAEAVLLESLAMLFSPDADDTNGSDSLSGFSDGQLLSILRQRLTPEQDARLSELLDLGNQGQLDERSEAELASLVHRAEKQMLLRSKALAALHRRGHDIDLYFASAV